MGISIGSAVRAVTTVPPVNRPDRPAVPRDTQADNRSDVVRRAEEPEIRAGFGENTLSPSGAALQAIDYNLEVAQEIVPTVQELRERSRAIQATRPDTIETRAAQSRDVRRLETVRPEPNPEARNFVANTEDRPVAAPSEIREPSLESARTGPQPASGAEVAPLDSESSPRPERPTTRIDLRA